MGRLAHPGDITCAHFHRWNEDVDLLAALGVDAYRFSVSWPRVIPDRSDEINQRGLDFYRRLVDRLTERGITPYPTLYHRPLPQALQDQGGWASRDTVEAFVLYAYVAAEAVGDRVTR